jgi:hypothetical protein
MAQYSEVVSFLLMPYLFELDLFYTTIRIILFEGVDSPSSSVQLVYVTIKNNSMIHFQYEKVFKDDFAQTKNHPVSRMENNTGWKTEHFFFQPIHNSTTTLDKVHVCLTVAKFFLLHVKHTRFPFINRLAMTCCGKPEICCQDFLGSKQELKRLQCPENHMQTLNGGSDILQSIKTLPHYNAE